ncbi:hypothetical protein AOLI_G00161570 [Acnodon oligacanthus]
MSVFLVQGRQVNCPGEGGSSAGSCCEGTIGEDFSVGTPLPSARPISLLPNPGPGEARCIQGFGSSLGLNT